MSDFDCWIDSIDISDADFRDQCLIQRISSPVQSPTAKEKPKTGIGRCSVSAEFLFSDQ
jgi:hypothetical protein